MDANAAIGTDVREQTGRPGRSVHLRVAMILLCSEQIANGDASERLTEQRSMTLDDQEQTAKRRRDLTNLSNLITADYLEMPDLCLTRRQIQQLWRLDTEICGAVLDRLERAQILRRIRGNAYVLGNVS
jgi:hypothetical protein